VHKGIHEPQEKEKKEKKKKKLLSIARNHSKGKSKVQTWELF
jgi:hypothetical protein